MNKNGEKFAYARFEIFLRNIVLASSVLGLFFKKV